QQQPVFKIGDRNYDRGVGTRIVLAFAGAAPADPTSGGRLSGTAARGALRVIRVPGGQRNCSCCDFAVARAVLAVSRGVVKKVSQPSHPLSADAVVGGAKGRVSRHYCD